MGRKYELISEMRKNTKLRDCAAYDKDHISEQYSPRGDWVGLIKRALNIWVRKQPESKQKSDKLYILPETNFFDRPTSVLVGKYKTAHKIYNRAGQIDQIVGINTLYFLDREFPGTPDPDPYHPPGVIFPPHPGIEREDDPNDIRAGTHFHFKSLDQFSLGANVGVFSYAIAICDIDNKRIAAYSYTGVLAQSSISPVSDSGAGEWTDVITTTKPIQVDQFGGKAIHRSSTALISVMEIKFLGPIIQYLEVKFPSSFSKSLLGVEVGTGGMSLVPGSVQAFKGVEPPT